MCSLARVAASVVFLASALTAADIPRASVTPIPPLAGESAYSWSTMPVGKTAELVTLSCHACNSIATGVQDVPLLSVLRDTLGDSSDENDRLTYVWLLNAGSFNFGQRLMSAVPFFYWRIGKNSHPESFNYKSSLVDLNAPLHPVLSKAGRNLMQWTAFDPFDVSVRATTRSYQANQTDDERLHLEQAIGYLRSAPGSAPHPGLNEREVNTLVARLELRKTMLGGLLDSRHTAGFGAQEKFEDERVRIRNYESMRQFAEKTGTYFEPLTIAGATDEYAVLWYPANTSRPVTGTDTKPIWKVLNIKDPWSDSRTQPTPVKRAFDSDGKLLPAGASGARTANLVPLAIYSLNYPGMPLLLIDFRDKLHVRRHEVLQRSITELTSGIIGISHFTNWYYYVGATLYSTVWSRRGNAANQADRLDCYSQLRTHLALDTLLDPDFRRELVVRAESLTVNPLDSDPARNVAASRAHLQQLQQAALNPHKLEARLDRERRAELAAFGQSPRSEVFQSAWHVLTFGAYTRRVDENESNFERLDQDRRVTYNLNYLDTVTANGTAPEVAFDAAKISRSIQELQSLLPTIEAPSVRQHAANILGRIRSLSRDEVLLASSRSALDSLNSLQPIQIARLNP